MRVSKHEKASPRQPSTDSRLLDRVSQISFLKLSRDKAVRRMLLIKGNNSSTIRWSALSKMRKYADYQELVVVDQLRFH